MAAPTVCQAALLVLTLAVGCCSGAGAEAGKHASSTLPGNKRGQLLPKGFSDFTQNSVRFFLADVSKQVRSKKASASPSERTQQKVTTTPNLANAAIRSLVKLRRGVAKSTVNSSRSAQRLGGAKYLLRRSRIDKPRMIRIGDMLVDAGRVTAVKDLDENGAEDYIVASPNEQDSRGAIRLYLMSRNGRVLRSRCIVPGKWGFDAKDLKPGDLFGSAVHVIHDVNGDGVPDIAVGAPGDIHNGQRKGAVYVLMMSRGGAVVAHSKISAGSDPVLREQHKVGEGFGSFLWSVRDINGDMNDELVVGSGPQSKTFTLVLLGTDGKAVGGVKFGPSADHENIPIDRSQHVARIENALSSVNETKSIGTHGQCIIDDSNCPCVQEKMRLDKLCLAPVHSNGRGRAMCKSQPCEASFRCSCQGTQMCSIASTQQKTFVYDGDADRGLSFCHEKKVHSKTVQLIAETTD
jgi:hypothetical protein